MQYNKVTPEFLAELEKIVPGKVHSGKDINEDFYRDEMPIYGSNPPDAVVDATTTEDIAAIAKLCYDNNIPIIPRGAGTGLTGASVAIHGGVMIDMQKMNNWSTMRIISSSAYSPESFCTIWLRTLLAEASFIPRIRVRSLQPWAETYQPTQAACALSSTAAQEIMCAL